MVKKVFLRLENNGIGLNKVTLTFCLLSSTLSAIFRIIHLFFGTIKASLNKNSRCICEAFIRLILKQVIFFITPRPLGYSKQNFDYVCFFFVETKTQNKQRIFYKICFWYEKSCKQSQGYLTTKKSSTINDIGLAKAGL